MNKSAIVAIAITHSMPPENAPPAPPTSNGQAPYQSLIICTAGALALIGFVDWLVFHRGLHFFYNAGGHVLNAICIAAGWIAERINDGFEAWGRAGRKHPEVAVWLIGIPTLIGFCHGGHTGRLTSRITALVGVAIGYFSFWVCLSAPGCAAEGFGAGLIGIAAITVGIGVLALIFGSDNP